MNVIRPTITVTHVNKTEKFLYIALVMLFVLACGAPVLSVVPETVNKNTSITSTQIEPKTNTAEMVVCKSGGLNIRPEAGDLSRSLGHLKDDAIVTVKLPAIVAPDMGLWYELVDGGFVNSRFLCVPLYVP